MITMLKTKTLAGLVVLAALAFPPLAQAGEWLYAQSENATRQYMVSGVLRVGTEGVTIKLVQSVEVAHSENEAVGAFTQKALAQYPGYSVFTTLVTPIPRQPQGKCNAVI